MQLNFILLLLLGEGILAKTPKILSSDSAVKTHAVNQVMAIEWEVPKSRTRDLEEATLLTIDLVNEGEEVLVDPLTIAKGVPLKQGKYLWTLPSYLKSSSGYHVRIYDEQLPAEKSASQGSAFSISNGAADDTRLRVLEPSGSGATSMETTCLLGESCTILWDYSEAVNEVIPVHVDIKLYGGSDGQMLLLIAHGVPIGIKSYNWQVPWLEALKAVGPVYVVISASGKSPAVKPNVSCLTAASGGLFQLENRKERNERQAGLHASVDPSGGFAEVLRRSMSSSSIQEPPMATKTATASRRIEYHTSSAFSGPSPTHFAFGFLLFFLMAVL